MAKNDQKVTQIAKWVIFKEIGSLEALFRIKGRILQVFFTCHMSRYLMKPIKDDEDFTGAPRNIQN